jgi:hypothetical protein
MVMGAKMSVGECGGVRGFFYRQGREGRRRPTLVELQCRPTVSGVEEQSILE